MCVGVYKCINLIGWFQPERSTRMLEICFGSSYLMTSLNSDDLIGHSTLLLQKKQHK